MSDNGERYNILADGTWEYPEEPVYPRPYDMTIHGYGEFSREPQVPDPYHYPSIWSLWINCQVTNNDYLQWIRFGPATVFGRKALSRRTAKDIEKFVSLMVRGYIRDTTRHFTQIIPEAIKYLIEVKVPVPPPMVYQIRIFCKFPPKMGEWMQSHEGEYEGVPHRWRRKHVVVEKLELAERLRKERREAARFREAIDKNDPW